MSDDDIRRDMEFLRERAKERAEWNDIPVLACVECGQEMTHRSIRRMGDVSPPLWFAHWCTNEACSRFGLMAAAGRPVSVR